MAWHVAVSNWLAHAALGGFLFLALGCLAVRFCHQPVRRLRLIELTLLGGLLAPWLTLVPVLPHWSLGLLHATPPASAQVVPEEMPVASPTNEPLTPPPISANVLAVKSMTPVDRPVQEEAVAAPAVLAPESSPASAKNPVTEPVPASFWIASAYGCLVAGYSVWWLLGVVQLFRLRMASVPAAPAVIAEFRRIAGAGGDRVRLLVSERMQLPLTFTWLRPVIILPAQLCQESGGALRFCLAHEWSHIEGYDSFRWQLASFAQFFFFYQPLFWWLRRQLRLAQDFLADARAAEQAPQAEDYAEYLVSLARRRLAASALLALGIGDRRSNLYRRILMLLNTRQPLERRRPGRWNLGVAVAALLILGAAAAIRLDAGSADEDKKDPPAKEEPKKEESKKEEPPKAETLHYTGRVFDKETDKGISGAVVTVRRSLLGDPELKERNPIVEETKHKTDAEGKYSFTIPPEQVAKRYLYIELDVEAPNYAPRKHFGYALGMIRKNEKLGGRPFFENVDLWPAQEITGGLKTPDDKPAAGVKVMTYSNTDKKLDTFEYGSFADSRTDDNGRFHIWVITPGPAYLWLLPEKYVPETHVLKDNKRGDLGTFVLHEGMVIRGRLLDAEGKPLAGVNVNAESQDRNEEITLPVADNINRSAVTNDKGEFEMNPLPPGNYQIKPDVFARDASKNDRQQRPFDAVFIAKKLTLKAGEKPEPIEVRASPHVVIEAQAYDSKGKKTRSHEFHIFGQIDGTYWFGQAKGDPDGRLMARVPHGLEQVQLNLSTNEHGALRWRRGDKGELHNNHRIDLGTVNDDVKDLQIIRYEAPILIVNVKGPEGVQLKNVAVTAAYAEGRNSYGGKLILANGRQSDVSFEHQEDGRFRSEQLFPDEEATVIGHAEGYESKPVKIKLAESEKKEIEVLLEKAPEKKDDPK
jgi:beta-lactamase regulating signal transducer with metallopeptidase domain/protocatechuate 3,4-dioxygenase beta subunit